MRVLIIGSGGREHALAWKVASSPRVSAVFVAPGNAGTDAEALCQNVNIASDNIEALRDFALAEKISLTIVGPEAPLVLGIVDCFQAAGLRCFGPSRACARLEGSKAFTKNFLKRHKIPTAGYAAFTKDSFDPEFVRSQRLPVVIKADGLAAGKGVVIATSHEDALHAINDMFAGAFGTAGSTVVVEEFLPGEEASFIVMVDGKHVLPLATSQDHKRLNDADQGPNTGGMGAYSPAPVVTPSMHDRIMNEVILPTVAGLIADGTPYTGFLYAGIMVAPDGTPNVLEFNCRFGDPETQPIMMRLRSDLTLLVEAALDGHLNTVNVDWDSRAAVGVVLAAGGYPDHPEKGRVIRGLSEAASLPGKIFHAATTYLGSDIVTSGGRVLCAVGLGTSVQAAQTDAYKLIDAVRFDGMQCRRDIGYRAIARELTNP
jgi:phosphoribosylamine--glycine ligase